MIGLSTIFFRLLNAAVVFTLLGYAFFKYVLPSIYKVLSQEDAAEKNRQMKKEMLNELEKEMEHTLAAQEKLGDRLSLAIGKWVQIVEKNKTAARQIQDTIVAQNQERAFVRLQHAQDLLIKKEIINPAIEQARTELKEHFSLKQMGDQYLNQLVAALEKKKL